jgi:hypothetical protein
MALISIKALADKARERGFKVDGGVNYLEIFTPEHNGPEAVLHGGCVYTSAEIIISDRPSLGYGYNGFFYGPWHPGLTQDTAYGVQKLLNHSAMAAAL